MLKKMVRFLFRYVNGVMNTPIFQEEDLHISWVDFEEKGKPKILLYSINPCGICKEIELWMSNNWIPHQLIKCEFAFPMVIPRVKHLIGLGGFWAKSKKEKHLLFLHKYFPQVDLMDSEGKWTRHIGNTKIIRTSVEDFIRKNIKHYPGFEAGVHGDLPPAEQAAQQMADILEMKTKGSK